MYIESVKLGFSAGGGVFEIVKALCKEIVGDVDFESFVVEDWANEYFDDGARCILIFYFFEIYHEVLHFFLNTTEYLIIYNS